jgi:hypothetical protein
MIPPARDDSWEQPGQEGEISLVASSTMVTDTDDEEYDVEQSLHHDGEGEGDSWNGMPVIISSPLNLPEGDGSRDISLHELTPGTGGVGGVEMSADLGMMVPVDMSNLLSERWSPTDPSFSISDPPPSSNSRMPRPTRNLSASPRTQSMTSTPLAQTSPGHNSHSRSTSPRVLDRASPNASTEGNSTDIMATVRKRASPVKFENTDTSFIPLAPSTPTPAPKPIGSIFAEMSAEQADMSWPLRGDDDESPLHSAVFTHDASALISPLPPFGARSGSERDVSTPQGDRTQFFDCSSSGFDLSLLGSKPVVAHSSAGRLALPTKELFEAQNEHARALVEEVKLYRDLATRLHAEVVERDTVLADLNGRVLDAEVLRAEVGELKDEVIKLRAGTTPKGNRSDTSLELSSSPLAAKSSHAHAGDRTTVVQAETRDLEIRLSKALAEQDVLRKQVAEVRNDNETKTRQVEEVRQEMADLEDRHRDQLISLRRSPTPPPQDNRLQEELDDALARCSTLEIEVTRACDKANDLAMQVQEMRKVKMADEEEIDRLNALVEDGRKSRRQEEGMRARLEEVEQRLEDEMRRKDEYVRDERQARKRLEQENRDVSRPHSIFLPGHQRVTVELTISWPNRLWRRGSSLHRNRLRRPSRIQ